jgi:hypothetical protein
VRVVKTFFQNLDFRRFQIDIPSDLRIDDASPANLKKLTQLGNDLAGMIVSNKTDKNVLKNVYGLPRAMKAK